ncbi:MAG TPA: TonB-dependent receptor [Blastocatellia bacterium]|nr:TonB-dependent receptor [Blastocatellia bacterium]
MKSKADVAILLAGLILLLTVSIFAQSAGEISGTVTDAAGNALAQASISLLNARQAVLATTQTDAQGQFTMRGIAPGNYEIIVTSRGFATKRQAVRVPSPEAAQLSISLGLSGIAEEVTITADLGLAQNRDESSQQVNVIGEAQLEERAKAVLAQVANEEPGLQLQRTSPTIGGVFVRGLTGNKVVTYIDGIRYSTSAMRGGISTFFNLTDAGSLRAVEILRGPNSAQFGSDSIGGSLQLIPRVPLFTSGNKEVHGQIGTFFNSADLSFGNSTTLTFGGPELAVLVNLNGHRVNTLRPGGGYDTHAAVARFLGLRSDIFGERLTDTAFTQYGGVFRLSYLLAPSQQLTVHYQRGQQDGGKRYDQTLGGDGNLIADLRNLMLDFFYTRYEKQNAGWFDTASLSYSYNTQREERVNQGGNGNPNGAITHQYERTSANGVQAQLAKHWSARNSLVIGGDFYRDRVKAPAYTVNPVNNAVTLSRPRVPDKATYRSGGLYAQDVWIAIPERLRLVASLRYSAAAYTSKAANSPLVSGQPLWPDDSLSVDAVTPRFGAVLTVAPGLTLSAQVSRGFRAPHITDLGTLGLTGNGFEVAVADLAGKGATIGTTADRNAVSSGQAAAQLKPETSWSYEGGIHWRHKRIDADVNGFVNNIYDNIAVQSLILPPGATGLSFGGQTVTSQLASGVVFVPASTNPVLVRANFGDAQIVGIEQSFDARLTTSLSVGNTFTWLHAEDKRTGLPPNIEGGTPAPQGWAYLRYESARGHFRIEPYVYAARRQTRLSSLDLEDRRTGATRSRSNIANFFQRGATVRGLIDAGADGRFGTSDDKLKATGETLAQVQNRVLGNATSAPLFTYIPGFVTFGIRGGVRFGERHEVLFDLENLNDKNYRGISWGIDAPGRGISARYNFRF